MNPFDQENPPEGVDDPLSSGEVSGEGTSVEGTSVEGTAVEGTAVDSTAVDSTAAADDVDGDVNPSERAAVATSDPDDLYWDDEEFVTVRPGWFRIGRGLIFLGVILFGAIFAYNGARGWFDRQLDPEGEPGVEQVIIVPNGATTADIGRILEDANVIPNSTFFRYYAQSEGEGNFQAGEYTFRENSAAGDAFEVLNAGPRPQETVRFTVQEGLWIDEILPLLASQLDNVSEAELRRVLAAGQINPRYRPATEPSWEGVFFPDTYEVNAEDDALAVLLKMSDQFSEVTGELAYGAADTQLGYTAYEVLIVASLVEAETRVDSERPLVASVIYNRLREGWALGIDATCVYANGERGAPLTGEILDNLTASENPYACRERTGLPPTPINAPGRASLEAAIRPEESTYMYYVLTDPAGIHSFAETDEEFQELKQLCIERGLGCG